VSSIEYHRILKDTDCTDKRRLNVILPDYSLHGFEGTECISSEPYSSISGEMINGISLEKNRLSDPSLNVYDLHILFTKELSSQNAGTEEAAVYVDDYFLGVYKLHGEKGTRLQFLVVNTDTDELIKNLNQLNGEVETFLIE